MTAVAVWSAIPATRCRSAPKGELIAPISVLFRHRRRDDNLPGERAGAAGFCCQFFALLLCMCVSTAAVGQQSTFSPFAF
jgi:hypothetical protein